MRSAPRAGFTLIELVIATLLASIVLIALSSILTPLIRTQAYAGRAQTVQLNLAAVSQLIERELRQASQVTNPASGGMSNALEGCATTAVDSNGVPTTQRWFAFCASGGVAYYHSSSGCTASYTCGTSPTAAFTWPAPWLATTFTYPSGSTLIKTVLQASSGTGAVVTNTSAFAFAAPAGGEQ